MYTKCGVDVNDKNANGTSSLTWAASRGFIECVELLLKEPSVRAEINSITRTGVKRCQNAIISALVNGHIEIAKLLCDFGADVETCREWVDIVGGDQAVRFERQLRILLELRENGNAFFFNSKMCRVISSGSMYEDLLSIADVNNIKCVQENKVWAVEFESTDMAASFAKLKIKGFVIEAGMGEKESASTTLETALRNVNFEGLHEFFPDCLFLSRDKFSLYVVFPDVRSAFRAVKRSLADANFPRFEFCRKEIRKPEEATNQLYLKYLPENVRKQDLKPWFPFKTKEYLKEGFGFVTFSNKQEAAKCLEKWKGVVILQGHVVSLDFAKPRNHKGQ